MGNNNLIFKRILDVPSQSFFLFGPRGTGKSSWMRDYFKPDLAIDLLKTEEFLQYSAEPSLLRKKIGALNKGSRISIDEVQKLPALLDEVHALIFENSSKHQFALTGSSSRKLKRADANMLAGRAIRRQMFPITSREFGDQFSIQDFLRWGSLPGVLIQQNAQEKKDYLHSYVESYMREEIIREAAVRNLNNYHRFLKHAATMNGQVVNLSNISREVGIPRATISGYFEIVVDTLLGSFVEPIHLKAKIKEVSSPKFYFFDCGVIRAIRNELNENLGEDKGLLLETFILNEIKAYSSYALKNYEIYFWATPSHAEVDFVVCSGKKKWAVEVKSSNTWKNSFNKSLHSASESNKLDRLIGVYLGKDALKTEDIDVFPVEEFCRKLFDGKLFS